MRDTTEEIEKFWDIKNLGRQNKKKQESSFARKAWSFIQKNKIHHMLEIGSGRGRDTSFFKQKRLDVTALEISSEAIKLLKEEIPELNTIHADVFEALSKISDSMFDCVYARLSLHYFNDDKIREIFKNLYRILPVGGFVFIENKSTKDFKFGRGEKISENAYRETPENPINYFFSTNDMQKLATQFEIVEISESTEINTDSNTNAYVSLIAKK